MRVETCIRKWLGLKARCVRAIHEAPGQLLAEIEAIPGRLPRCGCCGQVVRRTKGPMRPRRWRDLKIRTLALVLIYTPRRVFCPTCGVRVEQVPWADRWSRVWAPYYDVVRERAQNAEICFDRFHVVRHLNAAVDEVRRALVRKLLGPEKAVIKGTRFVLLKDPWNLTSNRSGPCGIWLAPTARYPVRTT